MCLSPLHNTAGAATASAAEGESPAGASTSYQALLQEVAAERARLEKLEKEVSELQRKNMQPQSAASADGGNSLVRTQVNAIQKTLDTQFGPYNFGDTINAFLGEHTFSLVGGLSTGFAYSRQSGQNQFTLDVEINPMIHLKDWLNFYASLGAEVEPGGVSEVGPSLANLEIFPFGWEVPVELVAGLFDQPFGDWYEDQGPHWINPLITAPLLYGAEAVNPGVSMGLQARGGLQWGRTGQDFDYTVWVDSGPTFESAAGVSAIPMPVIGETVNSLTGTNLSTRGKGLGARLRLYPVPLESELGRLELMASTYNGKWLNSNWYNAWGVGYAYRIGPFRTRGEWAQSYRSMPQLDPSSAYPGCCGHDYRQGWYAMLGYHLYGIPHPDLSKFLERRLDKIEMLVRYSGVNQRAIVANDITSIPVAGFNGSPSIFTPHAREVALGLDYWLGPSLVWQNEIDWELPGAGGTLYSFKGGVTTPTAGRIGATPNDTAILSQFSVGF